MNTTQEPSSLSVCVDCLMMLANGDLGQGDLPAELAHDAKMMDEEITLGWTAEAHISRYGSYDPDDEEIDQLGFSWQSCDCCQSTLGGDRYAATAWITVR